jgi:hypothetical protein
MEYLLRQPFNCVLEHITRSILTQVFLHADNIYLFEDNLGVVNNNIEVLQWASK